MDIDLALLADAATVDGAGKLNILGIFDRISVQELPARHGRLCLVLRFSATVAEAGEHALAIVLKDPEGGEVVRAEGTLQLGASSAGMSGGVRVPQLFNLDGLVFERAGRYLFDVKVDGTHQVSVPLTVVQVGGAGGGAPRAMGGGKPVQA